VTVQDLARRAAFDALALAGPDESGGGFMRTTDESSLLDPQRLALAREALRLAGPTPATMSPELLAERVVPRIRELVQAGAIR
jgi:hypothetical protein